MKEYRGNRDKGERTKYKGRGGLLFFFIVRAFILLLLASCIFLLSHPAQAGEEKNIQKINKIVIFPFENISGNFDAPKVINSLIEKELQKRGFEIVKFEDVDRFLSKRRIRQTSAIDRVTTVELYRELGADAVVIGSIDVYSEVNEEICVGLTIRLIGTRDCSIIWMDTVSHTGKDFEGLLGLGRLKSFNNLCEVIITGMAREMPRECLLGSTEDNLLEIGSLKVSQPIVGSGKTAKITARVVSITEKPVLVQSRLGGRIFDMKNENGDYYEGELTVPLTDGFYPIDIIAAVSNGKSYKFSSVDVIRVDTKPPQVSISTNKDITAGFTKKDAILFTLKADEDIEKWDVEIVDKNNRYVRGGKGFGALPMQLIWRGENDGGGKTNDGVYKFRLSVWDAAGNVGVFQKEIMLDTIPPAVKINAEKNENGEVVLNLDYENDEIMDKWELVILSENSKLIKNLSGRGNVTKKIIMPSPVVGRALSGGKMLYTFKAVDTAGNTFETSNQTLIFAEKKEEKFAKITDGPVGKWGEGDF